MAVWVGLPRSFSSLLVLLLALACVDAATVNVEFPENAPSSALANVVDDNFLGISFELSSFDTLWGNTTTRMPNAIQNYFHNLRARITNPLRIRIGGNGMDSSTYVPDQKSLIIQTDPDAYFNDVPVNFGPVFFDVMNAMYDAVGSMQFIIGLSMQDPDSDANPLLLATAARAKMGDRLDAMLLGNEPDLYAGHGKRAAYNISAYIPEVKTIVEDLGSANLLSDKIIGGPTVCCSWNLDDVIDAGLGQLPYKYYTIQHYPQNICGGADAGNINITYFLSHMNVGDYVNWNQDGIQLAQASGVPVILTEYNTVACGGSNVSDTFAASMWAVDAGLKSASANFTAVYLHTREWNVTYNLFDPPTPETSTESGWKTGAVYYSALFLSEAFSQEGSVVVDLNLNNSETSPFATVAGYGIYDQGGTSRGKLALFNYANGPSQSFTIPANLTDSIAYRLMVAPDVAARSNISWAGQIVGPNGDLMGDQTTTTLNCQDGCTVELPGPSVALLLLDSDRSDNFFQGNSTIAGYYSGARAATPLPLLPALTSSVIAFLLWIFIY